MKLPMLLSWWDEPPENLRRSIVDSLNAGCTHVIALDGAYPATPTDTPISAQEQYDAIAQTCEEHGVPCVLEQCVGHPEPAKRTLLFQLMYEHTNVTSDDWCFVMDADQTIDNPRDIKPWLKGIDGDVVDTLLYEHDDKRFDDATRRRFVRQMFRTVPGLHVSPANHWTYRDAAGRVMWGMNSIKAAATAPLVLHNWSRDRTQDRAETRDGYYRTRHQQQLEEWEPPTCCDCDAPWAFQLAVGFNVQRLPDGTQELVSNRTLYVCAEHGQDYLRKNAARAHYLAQGNAKVERTIAETMAGTIRRKPVTA